MKIKPSIRAGFTLTEIMIVVGILGLLAEIAIPNYLQARSSAWTNLCINNIRQIDNAKTQWALEDLRSPLETPDFDQIAIYMGHGSTPIDNLYCPEDPTKDYGNSYETHDLTTGPECKIRATHILP